MPTSIEAQHASNHAVFGHCDTGSPHIAPALTHLIQTTAPTPVEPRNHINHPLRRSVFHARKSPPSITIDDYLKRIQHYAPISKSCHVLAWIYLLRIQMGSMGQEVGVSDMTVHRLWIACVFIASKYLEDPRYETQGLTRIRPNFSTKSMVDDRNEGKEGDGTGAMSLKMCARIGGVPESELRVLELHALLLLDFNLYVAQDEFRYWCDQLTCTAPKQQLDTDEYTR